MAKKSLEEIFGASSSTQPKRKSLDEIFSSSSTPTNAPIQQSNSQQSKIEEVAGLVPNTAVGFAKGVGSTLAGASSLGEKILKAPLKLFGMNTQEGTGAEQLGLQDKLKPTNTAQKLGFLGEQIGEFFIPGGATTKLGKAAEAATKGGKLLKGAVNLGSRAIGEGGLALSQTAIQKGGVDSEAKTASALATAFPVGSKLAGSVINGIGKVGGKILGLSTGAGSQVIEEAFKNPSVIKFARQAGKDMDGFQDEILQQTKTGLGKLKNIRATTYQKQLEQIKLNPQQLDNITGEVRDKAVSLLDQFDINPIVDDVGKKLNALDFSKSTLVEGSNIVEKAFNDVLSWTDNTPAGLDKLKRRLGSFSDQLSSRDKAPAKYIVDQLRDTVNKGLQDNVKGYQEMTSGYAKASKLIDEINNTLSLGNKKARETGIKKIFGALRENNEQRKEMLKVLGDVSGEDLVAKVAGAQLGEITPRGLVAKIYGGGASSLALINPASIPAILPAVLLSSPRLVGQFVSVLGKATEEMTKLNKFSPEIQRAIREIIIKANQTPSNN